jgi:hypothetical protein
MNNTNYCAKYLAACNRDSGNISEIRSVVISFIEDSVKFMLPDGGYVIDTKDKPKTIGDIDNYAKIYGDYIDCLKLPYDMCTLEFTQDMEIDSKERKCAILVFCQNIDDSHIAFSYTLIELHNTACFESDFITKIDSDFNLTGWRKGGGEANGNEQKLRGMIASVVLNFIAALQCSNVVTVDQLAPVKLNKSRIKKGKQPFFDYKVLTIDTKTDNAQQNGGHGTGNAKRVHLRRGHIRRLADKTVWVNPCVVGDKSKGMITKDYKVV